MEHWVSEGAYHHLSQFSLIPLQADLLCLQAISVVVEHLVSELVMYEIKAEKEARPLLFVMTLTLACVGVISTPCKRHEIPLPMTVVCDDCELGDTLRMHRHT